MLPAILIGAALGGAAMYLLDPEQGRRRRALIRDQALRAQSNVRHTLDQGKRDITNRATALTGRARSMFTRRKTTDRVLVERVRAKMGHYVAHSAAIDITAAEGVVTLSGSILTHEHAELIRAVSEVPGVKDIVDRLSVYDSAEGIPQLQGGREPRGERDEITQDDWAPATRVAAGAAGTALALKALRGGFGGLLYGLAGALLLLRTTTNKPLRTLAGRDLEGAFDIQKSIHIDAPVERVFEFLANYENFPQFMRNVRSVQVYPDGRSHWVVAGPIGVPVEWDAYVTDLVPNETISWMSVEGSPVRHSGVIRLQSAAGGTRVQVRMSYTPPAGVMGHAVAKLVGADPKTDLDEDLLRLKSVLETGRTPRDAAAARHPQGEQT